MLTDNRIVALIAEPKRILSKSPVNGYREENHHNRCDLELESEPDGERKYAVFVRQNQHFIENYSIGLRQLTGDPSMGPIILVRYNGPHGEYSTQQDGHYATAHTHRLTEEELAAGSTQPQEKHREPTDRYGTFDEALHVFLNDIGVTNSTDYFPHLQQRRLFDGNC